MPAKAILSLKKNPGFSGLALAERVSLRKFSLAMVLLQAVPVFLVAVFVVVAAGRYGYFSIRAGLLGLIGLLLIFYSIMPRMSDKVIEGIMAFRALPKGKRQKILGQQNGAFGG